MTTQHYRRRSGGRAQCAVFTSWTRGSRAPPTSVSTGGGKILLFFIFLMLYVFMRRFFSEENLLYCDVTLQNSVVRICGFQPVVHDPHKVLQDKPEGLQDD